MIEVFLDGTQVYPAAGKTIKMTKENPSLTEKGEYSLDIELPLDIAANKKFFGSLGRSEVSKEYQTFEVAIMSLQETIASGTGHITKTDENTIYLQLKAVEKGMSEEKMSQYIDLLDLGYAQINCANATGHGTVTPVPADQAYRIVYHDSGTASKVHFGLNRSEPSGVTEDELEQLDSASLLIDGEDIKVAFPEKDGLLYIGDPGKVICLPVYDVTNEKFLNQQWFAGSRRIVHIDCFQYNFKWIIGKIYGCLGYTIDWSGCSIDATLLNSLYIANANLSAGYKSALPHWTVKELTEQLQILCQNKIRFRGDVMYFVANHFSEQEEIEIIDEIQSDITEEDRSNVFTTTGNVKYDLSEEHDYDIVEDEVQQSANVEEFDSYSELQTYYNSLSTADKIRLIGVTPEGYYVAKTMTPLGNPELIKVNHMAPRVVSKKSDDYTELKICPVALEEFDEDVYVNMTWHWTQPRPTGYNVWITLEDPTPHKAIRLKLKNERQEGNYETVWAEINGESSEEAVPSEDRMQLFIFDGYVHPISTAITQGVNCCPITDVEYKEIAGISEKGGTRADLSLAIDRTTASVSFVSAFASRTKINANAKHTFQFLSATPPDTEKLFLINGKLYLVEKVEYEINDDGVIPLMTGYFYEIEE